VRGLRKGLLELRLRVISGSVFWWGSSRVSNDTIDKKVGMRSWIGRAGRDEYVGNDAPLCARAMLQGRTGYNGD
jgi:hypothetical protein